MTVIAEVLSSAPASATAADVVAASVTQLLDSEILSNFCSAIASDPEVVNLGRASYVHENGFCKLTLGSSADRRFRLRLHLWQGNASALPDSNIHNHRFSFASCILRGRIENEIWRIHDEGVQFRSFAYSPRLGADEYVMHYRGVERLVTESVVAHDERTIYSQAAADLHVSNTRDVCVTMFVEARTDLRDSADVYSRRYPAGTFSIHSPALSPQEYVGRLTEIIRLVG